MLPDSKTRRKAIHLNALALANPQSSKLDDVRLHDLRHSFASVAASGGQSLVVIGKMLGHS